MFNPGIAMIVFGCGTMIFGRLANLPKTKVGFIAEFVLVVGGLGLALLGLNLI